MSITLNDIVALSKAGFTKDEIMRFHSGAESAPKQEKEPEPKQEATSEKSEIEKKMDAFLDKLLKTNLLAENTVIPDTDNKAYDFFANVIDPTTKEKKE